MTKSKVFLLSAAFFMAVFLISPADRVVAGQGCCSWHGGQSYCDYDVGRWVCNDNTYSPSCGCAVVKKTSCTIKITPSSITWGDSAVVNWNALNATFINSPSLGSISQTGTKTVSPLVDTTYNITVSNLRGSNYCSASIKVNPKIEVKTSVENEPIYFDAKTIEDNKMSSWDKVVIESGHIGSKDITYSVTYTNNVQTKKEKVSETIKVEPEDSITKVGTMNPFIYYFLAFKKSVLGHKAIYFLLLVSVLVVVVTQLERKYNLSKYIRKIMKGFNGSRRKK